MEFKKNPGRRRSIYILPNLITTFSLGFGFYSILASVAGRFDQAAIYIIISAICDGLDGTVARMTKTTSQFGVEYDSLCDLVAFGVAPAIMAFFWALTPAHLTELHQYSKLGSAAAFMFVACGALRLARFNVFSGVRDPGFFQGLPIPGGAMMVAAAVLWHYRDGASIAPHSIFILILVAVVALLMVSNIDYLSHKHRMLFKNKRPFETLVVLGIITGLIIFKILKLKSILLPLGFIYLGSGPIITILRAQKRRAQRRNDNSPNAEGNKPVGNKENGYNN